jgi:hypothetical protein
MSKMSKTGQESKLDDKKWRVYRRREFNEKVPFGHTDGPATINVNIYLRTISRIDDVKMVRKTAEVVARVK